MEKNIIFKLIIMKIFQPQEFIDWATTHKQLLIVTHQAYGYSIIDVSLHKKGPMQDKQYLLSQEFSKTLRRGMGVIKYQGKLSWARQGLPKFYDVQKCFFEDRQLIYTQRLSKNKIINQHMTQGKLVFRYKQNGQHCQISYHKSSNKWIIGSKFVTILAQIQKDLQQFQGIRFTWPIIIAKEWLKKVNTMDDQQKTKLKHTLQDKTLLGEIVGQFEHQHIIKYDQMQIRFYALVEHKSSLACINNKGLQSFLKDFKLNEVKTFIVEFNSHEQFVQNLRKQAQIIGGASISGQNQCGQGYVVYIQIQEQVRCIAKLKTSEYLIFRRLRQLLKQRISKQQTSASITRFKMDLDSFFQHHYRPPRLKEYYYQIGRKAFSKLIDGEQLSFLDIRYKFVDFLNSIQTKLAIPQIKQKGRAVLVCLPGQIDFLRINQIALKYGFHLIEDNYRQGVQSKQKILSILHLVPRMPTKEPQANFIVLNNNQSDIKQSLKFIQTCKSSKNPAIFSIAKSSNPLTYLNILAQKIKAFSLKMQQMFPDKIKKINSNQLELALNEFYSIDVRQISLSSLTVIIPLTIPGSGKSSIATILKSWPQYKNARISIISSDQIRTKILQDYLKTCKQKKLSEEQLFRLSSKDALEMFMADLKEQLIKPCIKKIIYLDKNYSPSNISTLIEFIIKNSLIYPNILGLVPKLKTQRVGCFDYPFPIQMCLTCLSRCILRQSHPTLSTDPVFTAKVIIRFYQKFKDVHLFKFKNLGIHGLIELDMIGQMTPASDRLRKCILQCLKLVKPGDEAPESPSFIRLIQQLHPQMSSRLGEGFQKIQHKLRPILQKYL